MKALLPFTLMLATILAPAAAQSVAGTYATPTSSGAITLTLEQSGQNVSGTLVGDDGTTFRVEGTFDGNEFAGGLANPTGTVAAIQGGLYDAGIQFYVVPLDANGNPNVESAQQFVMERQSGAAAPSPQGSAGLSGLGMAAPQQQQPASPSAPAGGQLLSGTYRGDIAGTPATLTLETAAGGLRGAIDAGGYGYTLQGSVSGNVGQGTLADPQTGANMPFEISEQAGAVTLIMLVQDPSSGQSQRVPFTFNRDGVGAAGVQSGGGAAGYGGSAGAQAGHGAGPAGGAGQQANVQRDPALVGNWSYNETYTSNDALSSFSAVTRYFLQISPDGSYAYGSGGMSAGLDNDLGSVSGNSGGGDVSRGQWRTENNIVYIMEPGSPQWVPYAKYYVEGSSMMFTFGNGKRQVWHRR